MSRIPVPELKGYYPSVLFKTLTCPCRLMDRHLSLQLNAKRRVHGVLRGYDAFMNLVLDEAYELVDTIKQNEPERKPIGMVVIRGNSVVMMEALDGPV